MKSYPKDKNYKVMKKIMEPSSQADTPIGASSQLVKEEGNPKDYMHEVAIKVGVVFYNSHSISSNGISPRFGGATLNANGYFYATP